MSFLAGAECSTSSNPLSQFTKHVQDDKSLQQDRLVGQYLQGLQESFRGQRDLPVQDEALNDFLQQNGQLPQEPIRPFAMEHMRRDLEGYPTASSRPISPGWVAEFKPLEQTETGGFDLERFSSADFHRFQQMERNNHLRKPSSVSQTPLTGYQRPMGMGYGVNMGMMGVPFRPISSHRPLEAMTASKGKERMVELDDRNWEQQFAEIDQAGQVDLDVEANTAIEAELNDIDRSVLSETNEFGDFESVWRGIQTENAATRGMFDADRLNLDMDMPLGNFSAWDTFDDFQEGCRDPQLGNYLFEQDNPFNTARDPYKEGLGIMNEGGNLSLAALAFEAAVQQDPQHVEAWSMLGNAQAQNEKETPAIRALEQALTLDPSNLSALMGLAISYTNENRDNAAYRTLERWLSVKYPQIMPPQDLIPDSNVGFFDRHLHKKVTALFIRAAQLSPQGDHMDPDVQVGLGVLFYGAEEHGKAVDCFEAALASHESGISNQPDQAHLLWNRLGATLANSGRSEEAIAAYEKALTVYPNFVRARYNLGVSCINIGCFEEAAQHLLGALAMHRVVEREGMARVKEVIGGNESGGEGQGLDDDDVERLVGMNQSTNLLETLRKVFCNMERKDLAEKVQVGMDIDAFRGEFDF